MEIGEMYLNASFFSVNNFVDVYILKTYLNMFIFWTQIIFVDIWLKGFENWKKYTPNYKR